MDRLLPPSASLEIWENGDFVLIPFLFQSFSELFNLFIGWQRHDYVITVLMLHSFTKADFLRSVLSRAPSEHSIVAKIYLWSTAPYQ